MLFIIIVIALILIKYGRPWYIPLFQKVKGKETIQSILIKIEEEVSLRLKPFFLSAGFTNFPDSISILVFKEERVLEVYGHNNTGIRIIKKYPFTGYSGKLGPKIMEGDKQIPEGIYKVEYLNPNSTYYLSLKINYPNAFDLEKSTLEDKGKIGHDIFIHGKSATVGCVPVGDNAIEEIFVMSQKSINNEIKVIISPRDFRAHPDYPTIDDIDWEGELYDLIYHELKEY